MNRVLLLNASYEPLSVISFQRAMTLIVQEKAEVVEATGEPVRTPSRQFVRPSVIRLSKQVRVPYRSKVPLSRKALMARDNHECQFVGCKRRGETIDHVQPRSKGGKHEWTNVVAACRKCNAKKADKLLSELGWELKRKPFIPTGNLWLMVSERTPEAWKPYLGLT